MSEEKLTTLEQALNALIQIEYNKLPDSTQLKALQQTVYAWLEPEGENSTKATSLFKQATEIRNKQKNKAESDLLNISIQSKIDSGESKNKTEAIESIAAQKAHGDGRNLWRKVTKKAPTKEEEARRIETLRRTSQSLDIVKKSSNNTKPTDK
jgi:hypothetical protein